MNRALRMFAVSVVASAALATAGWAQNPQAVISWGSTACPTYVGNTDYVAGTNAYPLWIIAKNLTTLDANVGYDLNLFYGPNVPDAWRMDDAGCQTGSAVTIGNNGASKGCPALKGLNSLAITNFAFDAGTGKMNVRLALTYDTMTPAAGINYTMWTLVFDHSFSNVGPTPPGNATCGGVEQPLCIAISNQPDFRSVLLAQAGDQRDFAFAVPSDQFITWNSAGGCPGTVPVKESTWGRVKGLYR